MNSGRTKDANKVRLSCGDEEPEMSMAVLPLPRWRWRRGSGSFFFENIEKVHEFDRILVFTSETL